MFRLKLVATNIFIVKYVYLSTICELKKVTICFQVCTKKIGDVVITGVYHMFLINYLFLLYHT